MFRRFIGVSFVLVLFLLPAAAQDSPGELEKLFAEGETLRGAREAEKRREAIDKFKELAPRFAALGLKKREADCLNNVGNLYKNLGDFENSLPHLDRALGIYREINETRGEFAALMNLGQSYRYLGRSGATDFVDQALSLARQLGHKEFEASALNERGVYLYTTAEIRGSLEPFELASAIFGELGKKRQQATLMNNLGLIRRTLGEQDTAIRMYQDALQIFRSERYPDGEADVALNLSAAYSDLFMATEAIEHFELALSLYRETGNKQREAVVLNNIGVFYNGLGDHESSRDHYQLSAEIAESIGNKRQHATALKNLGNAFMSLGQPEKALELLYRSLLMTRELKNRFEEATILQSLGHVYERTAEYEKGNGPLSEALAIFREVKNRDGEAGALYGLGLLREKTGKHAEAVQLYTDALKIRRELSMPADEARVMLGLARATRDAGDTQAAIAMVEEAIAKIESLRTGLPGHELRTAFFTLGKDAYDLHIDLLMRSSGDAPPAAAMAKAFGSAERSRARSLLESVFESRTDVRSGVDEKALERERRLLAALNARERYRMNLAAGKLRPEKLAAVEQEIRLLLDEYHQNRARMRAVSPGYSSLTKPHTLTLGETQQKVLDPETALLEYSIGDEGSYLWVVTDKSAAGHRLPKMKVIAAKVRKLYDSLVERNREVPSESPRQRSDRLAKADRDLEIASRELGDSILPPGLNGLAGKRLAIVPDGPLHFVPFSALRTGTSAAVRAPGNSVSSGQFLIETNEIVSLPSASTLAALRGSRERASSENQNLVSVVADPIFSRDDVRFKAIASSEAGKANQTVAMAPRIEQIRTKLRSDLGRLRFSRSEAESIISLVPAARRMAVLDFAANKPSVLSRDFTSSRILHFATHGLISTEFPELSGIVLSLLDEKGAPQDGFLRLHDIYNMRIDADLVVLSACDTALGREFKGEGIVGLSRGFMYAGASDVVASLWKVDDRATADLMKRFYQFLLKEKMRPAEALRRAQVSMIKTRSTQNPYYWAAFTIQGDWQ